MSKKYSLLLSFLVLLFVTLFCMLSYYSRLATDDYYFIWDIRNHGIWKSLSTEYMIWSGRFSGGFVADLIYKSFDVNQKYYILYPLFTLLLLLGGTFTAVGNISSYFNLKINYF